MMVAERDTGIDLEPYLRDDLRGLKAVCPECGCEGMAAWGPRMVYQMLTALDGVDVPCPMCGASSLLVFEYAAGPDRVLDRSA